MSAVKGVDVTLPWIRKAMGLKILLAGVGFSLIGVILYILALLTSVLPPVGTPGYTTVLSAANVLLTIGVISMVWEWFISTERKRISQMEFMSLVERQTDAIVPQLVDLITDRPERLRNFVDKQNATTFVEAGLEVLTDLPRSTAIYEGLIAPALEYEDLRWNYRHEMVLQDLDNTWPELGNEYFDLHARVSYKTILKRESLRFAVVYQIP